MALIKDGGEYSISTKEVMKSIEELFSEGKYAEMFQKASFKHSNSKDKKEQLAPFYKLVNSLAINQMIKENTIEEFFNNLNQFLDNRGFTDSEKASFFNGYENECIMAALDVNRFELAKKINIYRKDKDLAYFEDYLAEKADEENYRVIEEVLSISKAVTTNNSEILRLLYSRDIPNDEFFNKLISQYGLDINGVGETYELEGETCFTHMVACGNGTMTTQFFYNFIKEYKDKINFDVNSITKIKVRLNLFEMIFSSSLSAIEKLNRVCYILENCDVSIKHLGYICSLLIEKNDYHAEYYDHQIYQALFSHEQFNSEFFDREAILNKIVKNDTSRSVMRARKNNNHTVNPTSVILSKFFNVAKPATPMNKHPFITWIENQTEHFSKDTLKSLVTHYGDDLLNLDFRKVVVDYHVKSALSEVGFTYPKSPSWRVMLGRDSEAKKMRLISVSQTPNKEDVIVDVKQETVTPKVDNSAVALIDQVKDIDIKKLIESVHFNYQQYQSLGRNRMMDDNVHYMTELLPKFLKTTIDNYLHFSMLDSDYAKEEAIVQLKLLNRKAFSILKEELENEQKDMEYRNAVHKKVMENY
jgi:hypothetical protein